MLMVMIHQYRDLHVSATKNRAISARRNDVTAWSQSRQIRRRVEFDWNVSARKTR